MSILENFIAGKITTLDGLSLRKLLRKNPYLLKANNIITAEQLITALLEARISSSEEENFGEFLEKLAVFVAQQTCNGHKMAVLVLIGNFLIMAFIMLFRSNQEQIGVIVHNRTSLSRILRMQALV